MSSCELDQRVHAREQRAALLHPTSLATMPRQLASIMAEYAEHEASRKPTLFTRAVPMSSPTT